MRHTKKWILICILVAVLRPVSALTNQNVIFITWDGVRAQDFFTGRNDPSITSKEEYFLTTFWHKYAARGVVLGDETLGSKMSIANAAGISLPAYLSMMSGRFTNDCKLNQPTPECLWNKYETLPEKLLRQGTAYSKIAVFSSWDRIYSAAQSSAGTIQVNAGIEPFNDPNFPNAHSDINHRQLQDQRDHNRGKDMRPDHFTMEHAMTYLKNNRPKFLWIYLGDTDTMAHWNRYDSYAEFLRTYDYWLDQLIKQLSLMGEYGQNSNIIITTDHGRGLGQEGWPHHGIYEAHRGHGIAEYSKKIWAFIIGPNTKAQGKIKHAPYSHIHLRPTMEKMLGMEVSVPKNIIKEAF